MYSIELYANSAVSRWRTSITGNYDKQLQCTVHTLLNRKRLSRDHKNSKQINVDSDNCNSTRLTSNSLQTTENGEWQRINAFFGKKTRGIESWSDINCYSIYHIRSNRWLILRCKTIFHKVALKCPDTSAPVPKCLADNLTLVKKCPGPWVRSVFIITRK